MSPFIKVFGFNRRTRKHPPANKPFSENPFVSLSEIFHDGWAGLGTLKHLFQLLNKGYAKFRRLMQNNKLERSNNCRILGNSNISPWTIMPSQLGIYSLRYSLEDKASL